MQKRFLVCSVDDEVEVKLLFRNDLIGVVMDRFGKNVFISKLMGKVFS